jgi:hypothetical protein
VAHLVKVILLCSESQDLLSIAGSGWRHNG